MEILIIILGVTTVFFSVMWLLEIKKHGKNVNDVLNKMALNQVAFDVLEDKYSKLKYKQQQTQAMLEAVSKKNTEQFCADLKTQTQWAIENAIAKKPKSDEKKQVRTETPVSNLSNSTRETDYEASQNLSIFSPTYSTSSSDYSSSSDSYSGGGGDTGGGGSGGDW